MKRIESPSDLTDLKQAIRAARDRTTPCITVCGGTGCNAFGSQRVRDAIEAEIERRGIGDRVTLKKTGCHGFCERGPVMVIQPQDIFYQSVSPDDVPRIIDETILAGKVIDDLLYSDPSTGKKVVYDHEVPFYQKQKRLVFRHNGLIDPTSIEDYLEADGYEALAKALWAMSPEQIIEEVKKSGLRGRGGAGFPTGVKWGFCRAAQGGPKYLICNADEGDPGAFMDRSVLEGDPHAVIEGMVIAARAIGATEGIVYVRAEYPLAVEHLRKAIGDAEEAGLLGDAIMGTDRRFQLKIKEGAGAFICGEETALIASIEGRRGMPRVRPPFPANSGLWGKPTNINNVETFANVPYILLHGSTHYRQLGTEESPGTKIFALAGKVNNTGLVEVPMGATLRQIVFDIGGGVLHGRKFKAAQTGGPSGGCVPPQYLDYPLDYDSLKEIGAIMGSGGLIVMDEATCMVDIARYFLEFTQSEACGKCVPCRIGTKRMLEILTRITEGNGKLADLDTLSQLAEDVKEGSLCALGKTAPNPVLSTLRYFRDEYEAHIVDRRCPAGACPALVASRCQNACPAGVNVPQYIALVERKKHQRAVDLVRRRNPFASVCGRVCHHPCETVCRRGELDDPIAIMHLKRVAADYARGIGNADLRQAIVKTGKKVAIVGAGPAGLSAAYFLAIMGHRVRVYEAMPKPGGMLTYAIPDYRLPPQALERDIGYIKRFGVKIETGVRIGQDIPLDDLLKKNDAVFVAPGTHRGMRLGAPGGDAAGVVDGLTLLKQTSTGDHLPMGRRVVVIGGGNVAMDASRTALRRGAESVTVLYRRSEAEMPALPEEIREAREEGVDIQFLCAPTEVLTEGGRVKALRRVRMKLGQPDESGRRRPVPIEGSESLVECDTVIEAIGQQVDPSFADDGLVEFTEWGTVMADPRTQTTKTKKLFAGGDCVTGGLTVVDAVAAGQRAAMAIDKQLGGCGELPPNADPIVANDKKREEGIGGRPRVSTPLLEHEARVKTFDEVQLCYPQDDAVCEASRCLRCDLETE